MDIEEEGDDDVDLGDLGNVNLDEILNAVEEVKESGILAALPQATTSSTQISKPTDQGLKGLPEAAVFGMDKKLLVEKLQNMPKESLMEFIATISEELKAYIFEILDQVEREGAGNEVNPEMQYNPGVQMGGQLNENVIRGTGPAMGMGYGMNVQNPSMGQPMRNMPNQGIYNPQYGSYDMGPVTNIINSFSY